MTDPTETKQQHVGRSNMPRRTVVRLVFAAAIVFFALPGLAGTVRAQEPDIPDAVPPPLKVLSRDEKNQLKAEIDPKKHTSLALELTEGHLAKAEELSAKSEFDLMFKELGSFNAVIDEALDFLGRGDSGSGRILNSSKKLEIGLRSYSPRLEAIRRDVPSGYEPYVRNLIKTIRDARSRAIEPFFGTSVIPQQKNN